MKFSTILRIVGRRDIEQPEPKLPHRGGGLLENPNPPGRAEKWEPPTKGTTVADRKRIRRRAARAARAARRAERLA